jgi:Cytochrome oxidase maturation protein cbb3-type
MKTKTWWLTALWVTIVVVAALAFIFKMTEFAFTWADPAADRFGGFAFIAVGSYLLGMFPILLLMLWAVLRGHFQDIEQPKYRMLELQEEIERYGNRVPPN